MMARFRLTPIALVVLSLGAWSDAWSQPATDGASATLDRVEISSGKRPQKQREVAGTVTAVQGEQLEALGAQDQEDVFKLTPGAQLNKGGPARALPTIRGVGTVTNSNALGTQQGTTGVYIEDVPFTDPWGFVGSADLAPFDLDRVEILRGPQGALYGSASLGGAVLYQLNKPVFGKRQFSVFTTVDSVSHGGTGQSIYAMANLPLGESAAMRAVLFDRNDPGYIDNIGTGQDRANSLRQHGGRVSVGLRPTQGVRLTTTLLHQETHANDTFAVSPDPGQLQINTPTPSTRTTSFTLANVKADVDIGANVLTSNTAYLTKKSDSSEDLTRRLANVGALVAPGLPVFSSVIAPIAITGKASSEEIRFASKEGAPWSYVVGAFYQRTTFNAVGSWVAPGGAAAWGPLGFLLPHDSIVDDKDHSVATEKAVFADTEYAFGNGLSVGAGGRKYRNHLEYGTDTVFLTQPLPSQASMSESGFTPKFTVKYRWGDQLWYALASKGYRFGGVNPIVNIPFKSDSLWNYETGLRLSPTPAIRADIAAFLVDWKDAQVNAVLPGPVPVNGIANVGAAKIKGLEGTVSWKVTSSFNLNASVALTDAKTTAAFTSNNGAAVASGTRLPGTAKLQTSLQAVYKFDGPFDTSGSFTAIQSHVGNRTLAIDSPMTAGSYNTTDLRVSFSRDAWEATLFVNNAFDSRGVAGAQIVPGFGSPTYTDYFLVKPRTIGVSLRYDY